MVRLTHPNLGWSIEYEQGSRLADLFDPDGSCVDCIQVRDWDWARAPYEQDAHEVTEGDLTKALEEYVMEQGLFHLADGNSS